MAFETQTFYAFNITKVVNIILDEKEKRMTHRMIP